MIRLVAGKWLALVFVLCLTSCKIELYNGLSEEEANQMLALLMLRNIDAEKQAGKSGDVSIRVEKEQFVNAVEVLRQNGLPKRRTDTMSDLFPAGQLVTSPTQEQAKMTYLKEQQLEKMLNSMDGVIHAQVSIAEEPKQDGYETANPSSAAVFIKYSPEVNLANREAEIKSLIHDGIPNLRPEKISIVLQAADYRYLPNAASASSEPTQQRWYTTHKSAIIVTFAIVLIMLIGGGVILRLRVLGAPGRGPK